MAIVIIPVLVLLVLELSLRMVGSGYPAGALRQAEWKSQKVCYNNYQFGWRFWPPAIARESEPLFFTAKKPPKTYRIFVLGGSAALGTPEPAYAFSRYLEIMLEHQYPQVNFEVINTAITAINSHVVLPIARACAPHDGDLFIVYLGNNEVIGPYGAGTIFAGLAENMSYIRLDKAVQHTRLGQLLKGLMQNNDPVAWEWGGLKMFMKNLIRKDNEKLQVVYKHYQRNLQDIIHAVRPQGAAVILCSVGSNLKDNAPFASLHRPDLTEAQKQQWQSHYRQAIADETAGKMELALAGYLAAGDIDDTNADLHFRMARTYEQMSDHEKAKRHYILAREYDTLRLRADHQINQIVQAVAATHKGNGVYFVDAVQAFAKNSPHQIPGEELFYEHVHLNSKGNYILAGTVFEQIEKILPESIKHQRADIDSLTEQQCAHDLAYTQWDRYQITAKLLNEFIKKAPFTSRLYNDDQIQALEQAVSNLKTSLDDAALQASRQQYLQALEKSPDDWWLHWKFALLLAEGLKNPREAAGQYQIVTELLPLSYLSHAKYGLALSNLGRYDEAIASNQQALKLKSTCVDAHHILGIANEAKGQVDQAMAHFTAEVRLRPDRAQGYNRLAILQEEQRNTTEAENTYRRGLLFSPDDLSLHFNLARLLLKQKRFEEAEDTLNTALTFHPKSFQLQMLLDSVKKANR